MITGGTLNFRGSDYSPKESYDNVELYIDGKRVQIGKVMLGSATISSSPDYFDFSRESIFREYEFAVDFTVIHRDAGKEKPEYPSADNLCSGGGRRVSGHSIVKKKVGKDEEVVSYFRCPECNRFARIEYIGLLDPLATLETPAWEIQPHYAPPPVT